MFPENMSTNLMQDKDIKCWVLLSNPIAVAIMISHLGEILRNRLVFSINRY